LILDHKAEQVATKAGPNANPRAKVVFSSLIRHLHAFAREVELTNEEWVMACDSMIQAGTHNKVFALAQAELTIY
jgi:hypothetical protein